MNDADRNTQIDDLLAKQEIAEVVLRYCRGIDRVDPELVRSCYHPDATDEHGSFSGNVDEFLEWVFRVVSRYSFTMHFVGNLLVELGAPRDAGNRAARAETYGISHHRTEGAGPGGSLILGFRYIDRFEQRDGGPWKGARRICTTEGARIDEEKHQWPIPEGMRSGLRDRTDPVYDPID